MTVRSPRLCARVGAVTNAVCAAKPGDVLGLRGPFGTVWPLAEAEGRDVVVIAGGIGLAPLRPVVHELLAHRDRYGTRVGPVRRALTRRTCST